MKKNRSPKKKRRTPKPFQRLPDLDQAKATVLNALASLDAQRGYRHAIEEFIDWYCSELRLSFNKTVVLRNCIHLESQKLAPGTINLRLEAVRRLFYEVTDWGSLNPDPAAGIRPVKGGKKIGVRRSDQMGQRAATDRHRHHSPCADRQGVSEAHLLLSRFFGDGLGDEVPSEAIHLIGSQQRTCLRKFEAWPARKKF